LLCTILPSVCILLFVKRVHDILALIPPYDRAALATAAVAAATTAAAAAAADPDWFAAMSALEKVQKVQQARALQQLRFHTNHRHSSISGIADDDTEAWYDARSHTMSDSSVAFISDAEREEVARLAHEIEESEHAQGQLTVSVVRELEPATPNCVPNPPLLFAEKHWKYIPVSGCGYIKQYTHGF
jgi:hypothetical protein